MPLIHTAHQQAHHPCKGELTSMCALNLLLTPNLRPYAEYTMNLNKYPLVLYDILHIFIY